MKIIITENQKIESIQKFIDSSLDDMRDECDNEDSDDKDEGLCDELSSVKSVKVVGTGIDRGAISVFLDFYTESIFQHQMVDDVANALQRKFQTFFGRGQFIVWHNGTIHNKIDSNW